MFFLGIFSFILFFFSDLNDVFFRKKTLRFLFPLGALLLAISVGFQAFSHKAEASAPVKIIFSLLALVFLVLTVYSLFFAIPVDDAYKKPGQKRRVCTAGMYALCRHPGVLWLSLFFICLSVSTAFPFYSAIVYIVLDILLVIFEDIVVFPQVLEGYGEYRKRVPFLIPNARSIACCLGFFYQTKKGIQPGEIPR